MESFLYQQHQSFILDSVFDNNYLSNSPINDMIPFNVPRQNGDLSNVSSCFQDSPTSSLDVAPEISLEKKRKQSDESCLSSCQSKGVKESKSRKKNQNGGSKKSKDKELKDKKETSEEPPFGYIHVRARRGQATDSHSLAERVRRERISERMKTLQGLVPGCDKILLIVNDVSSELNVDVSTDKVIGKALVLDEIINYVQSLQNQVEFLSMKIASLNPILYDFGVGFEDYMSQPEEMGSISQPMPSRIQNSRIPPSALEGAANSLQPVMYGQGPHNFSQDSNSFLMLNNMCSFQ